MSGHRRRCRRADPSRTVLTCMLAFCGLQVLREHMHMF